MGVIAEVLQFFRGTDDDAEISEAKGELGGGDVVTAVNYQPAGFDAFPLTTDYMLLVPGPEAGTFLVAGYLDPLNAGTASEGEVRLYARDGDGNITGSIMLKTDGTVHIGEDTGAELIARADRVDAELEKIKTTFNSIVFTVDTGDGTGLTGTIGTPYSPSATGADKGWVT